MKSFCWSLGLGVTGVAIALSAGCNHTQKQHTLHHEGPCPTGTCDTITTPSPIAPSVAPAPLPQAAPAAPAPAQMLPPVANNPLIGQYSTSAKIGGDASPATDSGRRTISPTVQGGQLGHAADYSWLVGQLHYIHAKKQWRLRFAGIDQEDPLGGSVTLQGLSPDNENFRDGMMVRVEGNLVDPESRQVAPLYRVANIAIFK